MFLNFWLTNVFHGGSMNAIKSCPKGHTLKILGVWWVNSIFIQTALPACARHRESSQRLTVYRKAIFIEISTTSDGSKVVN